LAGLYIHIPFCKQACHYCDFHFSTNQRLQQDMVEAICQEISFQKDYLKRASLESIYFGGGTPSLLTSNQLQHIFDTISNNFTVAAEAEITLEANPDDLNPRVFGYLSNSLINRLSIGIQSFYEPHLRFMHRAHTATEAETCVKRAQDAGFDNLTIDLIYGIPHPDHTVWQADLQKAVALQVPHISAYCLTIEPQTVFGKWVKQKKIDPINDEFSAGQFELMLQTLEEAGFEQYEISNFARDGRYARHNSGYWLQKTYLGIGPSAHSYNGISRQFNIANNARYIQSIEQNTIPCTIETLTTTEQINDYLLTALRTRWGCDLTRIQHQWQYNLLENNKKTIEEYLASNLITLENCILKLTKTGRLLADEIVVRLIV